MDKFVYISFLLCYNFTYESRDIVAKLNNEQMIDDIRCLALDMINEGVLENPDVDAAVAIHLWSPIISGNIGLSAGPILGTTEEFELKIIGRSGHTSTPHTGKDAVLGAVK